VLVEVWGVTDWNADCVETPIDVACGVIAGDVAGGVTASAGVGTNVDEPAGGLNVEVAGGVIAGTGGSSVTVEVNCGVIAGDVAREAA
jgi:hypothetical protein